MGTKGMYSLFILTGCRHPTNNSRTITSGHGFGTISIF